MFAVPQDDGMSYTQATESNVSLLDDGDDREGLISASSSSISDGTVSSTRRVERHMTLRDRLENLKQQASERFAAMTANAPAASASDTNGAEERFSYADVQKAVDDTIKKLTDTLYRDLDYEKALVFIDDIKSWSGGMPTMLPIVVSSIERRLRNEDPHVTFLSLCLIDTLVKNTSLNFHRCVATQPIMSTIARIARGSAHQMQTYTGDLRKDAGALWNSLAGKKPEPAEKASRERACRAATTKAKEVTKIWAEGFVQTAQTVPLFAETYQTLLNEGMIFPDVHNTIVLDAPEVSADGTVHLDNNGHTTDMAELSDSAHQTAKLLAEVCANANATANGTAEGEDETETTALVQLLVDQCKAQQAQLANHIEMAMTTGDEPQLISALAANEALQEALACSSSISNGNLSRAEMDGGSTSTGATAAAASEFASVMGDVDNLLFADDGLDSLDTSTSKSASTAAVDDGTVDLLDLDFLTFPAPVLQPAAPVCPPATHQVPTTTGMPSIRAAPIAPPPMPPPLPLPSNIPAIPAAPAMPPPAFALQPKVDDVEDDFAGLVLQRKQKHQLQEL